MKDFKKLIEEKFSELSKEEILELNKKEEKRCEDEYSLFVEYYIRDECSICKKSLYNFSINKPCLHYLLRLNKSFKKKNFNDIFNKWWYSNISAYLRWISNQERFASNINNLIDEKWENKKFEYTIKWKNIEWTFSCSEGDYLWHSWVNSAFPHYHFQMKIDWQIFIKFSDFHIRFKDYDLFTIACIESDKVKHRWGEWGAWIQEIMDIFDDMNDSDKDDAIRKMVVSTDENNSHFRVQTFISWNIKWEDLDNIMDESGKSWKTMNTLLKEKYPSYNIQTIISPTNDLPDISRREWWRWKNKK